MTKIYSHGPSSFFHLSIGNMAGHDDAASYIVLYRMSVHNQA